MRNRNLLWQGSGACLLLVLVSCADQPAREAADTAFVARQVLGLTAELAPNAPVAQQLRLGEEVQIVRRRRRFVYVRNSEGVEGWTKETELLDQTQNEYVRQMRDQTDADANQGTMRSLSALNVHLEPYRWSANIYRLAADEPVEMLRHRTVERRPDPNDRFSYQAPGSDDWYLIRTRHGQPGWVLATGLYTAIPDEVAQYQERKRILSYHQLGEPSMDAEGQPKHTWLWTQTSKARQSYDFDVVRVFQFSAERNVYQTVHIQRGVRGYLPVRPLAQVETKSGSGPGFAIVVENDGRRELVTYALLGRRVRRVSSEPAPPPPAPIRLRRPTPPPAAPKTLFERLRSFEFGS